MTPTTAATTPGTEAIEDRHSSGVRRMTLGLVVLLLGALAPVLAELVTTGRVSTLLWIASMPLCLAGAAILASGFSRWRSARAALAEDWG